MPALFHVDLGLLEEYDNFLSDVLKWLSILFTMHVFKVIGGNSYLFSGELFQNSLIAIVGLGLYHLVIKKIVKFVYSDRAEEGFSGTIRVFKQKKKRRKKKKNEEKEKQE